MQITRYIRSLLVTTHIIKDGDVGDPDIAYPVFKEFIEHKQVKLKAEESTVMIPFHAIDHVVTSVEATQVTVDSGCDLSCSVMPDPTLTAPTETIEVDAGEEFDPMEGVSAVDGNGNEVEVTVSVEEDTDDGYLQDENGTDITDENDNPLIGG